MNKFIHVFYTWVVTIQFVFNSVLLYELIKSPWNNIAGYFSPQMFMFVLLGYVSALPSLFFCIVFLSFLLKMRRYSIRKSFFLWYLSVVIAAFLNFLVVALFFGMTDALPEIISELWIVFPAAILAVTIRSRCFFSLLAKLAIGESYSDIQVEGIK